ncbi:MAG TPA: AMP-binding protein [Candidatus Didemnitutus sp.]|jgi:acyl-[acyl-carrier-protein]-phospholipid O-acyltransferase/long-chain-fatty-acid--[acyl-carrier-protein] ligase
MKTLARLFLRLCFGFKTEGANSLRTPGPVLLIPNHTSWLDWLFLYAVLDSDWKFVTSSTTADTSWILRRVMVNRRTFPVDTSSPYAVKAMAEHLERGGRLVLFAEGRITLTGSLMKIYDGTGFLIRRSNARVITCFLRGANRLRFVRHHGWRKWFPRVSAHFSAAHHAPDVGELSAAAGRQRLATWLRDAMVRQQFEVEMVHGPQNVLAAVGQTAAAIPGRVALEDFTFQTLTYRRLMAAGDILAREGGRRIEAGDGRRVGVLLPNVNSQPALLLGLWEAGFVPAMLNYSTGAPTLLQCAQLAGLRSVVTSRAFLPKARLDPEVLVRGGLRMIYLEDVVAGISRLARWTAWARNLVSCGTRARATRLAPDDTAIILFTSGSEGVPKGVELTHRNLLANIRQAAAVIDVTDDDRFFNALPLFHSFGLTGGTLFPLVRGCRTFLYPSPLHYRVVPALVYDRACTVLLGTNTFLNGYARKAHAYDFNSVRYLIAGAEKVQSTTFETWAQKFGVRILEGYGATECSPLISLNTRMEPGLGTAGRLVPGMEARLEGVDGVGDGGRLFVRGPNVMKGYLNPDANARFRAQDGWYDTGDIVHLDDNGFLHIRGRLKRFAKVSGEMVSLTAVEDALAGPWPQFGQRCQVAVIAVPDDEKGEKLVAVTNESRLPLADLRAAVRARGLSNLCAPREVRVVRSIPKLGTGKTDHRALQRLLAEQNTGAN